jgi:hypothetical protein
MLLVTPIDRVNPMDFYYKSGPPFSDVTGTIVSPEEARAQQIKDWAESGEICRIYGHWWKRIPLPMVWPSSSAEQRRCKFCGKVETKVEEWK